MKAHIETLCCSVLLGVSLLLGCSTPAGRSAEMGPVRVAKDWARERLGWKRTEVGYVEREGNLWRIMLWRLPKMPGGFGVFWVSDDGRVVTWRPGA